jgi:hypothetical protein
VTRSTPAGVLAWLRAGDPSIRWQVMRDLLDEPETVWRAEQARIGGQGWGARLLAHQDDAGRWTPRLYGRKWISTTYSMLLLWRMGLPSAHPAAARSCALFLDEGLSRDGGIDLSATQHRSETCITGMVLGILCWFGATDARRERLVDHLLAEQMTDGGWNCRRDRGATHSSFHTTINVLEGLRAYASTSGPHRAATEKAEASGREFLLRHRLYRSHHTGQVVDPTMTRLSFPPYWRYDVLRALDHFQSAGAPPDRRLLDAIDLLDSRRRPDSRWPLQHRHPGAVWFDMERVGAPSRWNTLRALRVQRWWQRTATGPTPLSLPVLSGDPQDEGGGRWV